jgi:dTMP kinase
VQRCAGRFLDLVIFGVGWSSFFILSFPCLQVLICVLGLLESSPFSGSHNFRFAMMLSVTSHTHRGRFITFEGLDGCGKTTQLEKLAAVLRAQNLPVVVTREPGGTPTGDKVRQLLLDSNTSSLAPLAELALMFASRAQHIAEVIEPALAEGSIVLCDRFTDSTEAYQGGGRRLGHEPVLALHRILCGSLWPEITILMDSEVAMSVDRARRRNQTQPGKKHRAKSDENRFEQESRAFFGRVRNAYLAIASREPDRVVLVDARGTPDETHRQIVEIIRRKVKVAAKTS